MVDIYVNWEKCSCASSPKKCGGAYLYFICWFDGRYICETTVSEGVIRDEAVLMTEVKKGRKFFRDPCRLSERYSEFY